MRILCLSHYYPFPPDGGGPMRVHGLLRALAAEHEVKLLATRRAETANADRSALQETLRIGVEDFPPPGGPERGAGLWLRSLASRMPPWVRARQSAPLRARALDLAPRFDAVVILDDYAGAYAPALRAAGAGPIVADKPVVLAADPFPEHGAGGREWAVRALGGPLTKEFERRYLRAVDAVVVTSEEEAARLRRAHDRTPDAVVVSAVDVPEQAAPTGSARTVAWIGSLDGRPIVDGLVRFVEGGWERLGRQGFELRVAGRGAPREVRALERFPGVRLVGYVDDADEFLASCGAAVIPLWAGQGVKLKTPTLLGAGLPTAATPVALEGVPAIDGEHCLVADDPAGLAAALERIASDPELAGRLGAAGRRLVRERFSWEAAGPAFVAVVEQATNRGLCR
jgi:glycosyltransferase involved in cell wall biosynthesis